VDLERIRELRPTHVILNIDENEKPVAEALSAFVPNLIVTHPLSPLDNLALYRLVGGIFNRCDEAEALCTCFQAAHDEMNAESPVRRKALYVIWKDPWMTISRDTYISRTLDLAGLETLPASAPTRYPEFSPNEAWAADVDVVLLSTEPYIFRQRHVTEVAALPAFAGKPVCLIDGEMTSWYGSRAIEGLAYLREFRRSIA
jgi:ABC-type Fe3+-hydroxamate transport system substrate-binding protein